MKVQHVQVWSIIICIHSFVQQILADTFFVAGTVVSAGPLKELVVQEA